MLNKLKSLVSTALVPKCFFAHMKERRSLQELFESHRGKVSDKWSSYLRVYSRSFEKFRTDPISILEIGIQNGGSLEIYQSYFHSSSIIVGCDINTDCLKLQYGSNVHFVLGDCCERITKERIMVVSPCFDIIIDDGSHRSDDIIKTFLMYFPILKDGGIFIIEDLHASYWSDWDGGLMHPHSSMSFLKLIADTINTEHWCNGKTIEDYIGKFFGGYRDILHAAELDKVYSIQFFNSICVIEKNTANSKRGLGHRMVTGLEAVVMPNIIDLDGTDPLKPDQSKNPFGIID